MIRINEEEEEDKTNLSSLDTSVPSIQSECKNIYSSKQTDRSNSLPPIKAVSSFSPPLSNKTELSSRRRHASDSHRPSSPTFLVTSFLHYLRNQLRATTNNRKNDYQRFIRQKSLAKTFLVEMNSKISNDTSTENNDENEILTLVDLLVLRVECLTNENKFMKKKKVKTNYPSVAEVDQNLIEYLYFLFTKFTNEESKSILNKTNFVNVCQTLVRNGCFDVSSSTSPDQSFSEATSSDQTLTSETTSSDQTLTSEITSSHQTLTSEITSSHQTLTSEITSSHQTLTSETTSSDQTLTSQPIVQEYQPENDQTTTTIDNNETWLVVDIEPNQTGESYIIPNSPSDDQLLSAYENDKSYESFSSPSLYLSPNTSTIDLRESDEHSHQDGSTTLNVMIDSKTTIFDDQTSSVLLINDNIYPRLTNDEYSIENNEQMTNEMNERMSQREKKMQERWAISTNSNANEQSSNKVLIGIDFPQISVLRRKFSTLKKPINSKEEINTSSTTTMIVDNTNPDQINELLSKDLSITNVDRQQTDIVLENDKTMKIKQEKRLSFPDECQTETITNANENSSVMRTNSSESNLLLSSASSSSINEKNTIEPLEKEKERPIDDSYNLDEEKKNNNSNFVYDNHASGILLINDEPTQLALLVEQEKKDEEEEEEKEKKEEERERTSPPLLTLEQSNQQRTEEDESPIQILSNDFHQLNRSTTMDESDERYKKVEIEEIPDEDDEEAISTKNIDSIEPMDYIRTDEEVAKKSTTTSEDPFLSCYEKAFSKVVDTNFDESSQPIEKSTADDPIALRALQRFEERMNAAAAAKTSKDESTSLITKGKSSWSGSLATQRKSMENLFKNSERSTTDESSTLDSFIRPRKTFDETNNLNYATTLNLSTNENDSNNNNNNNNNATTTNVEQTIQPTAIVEKEDKGVIESQSREEEENQSKSTDESGLTPYRFQIEGRRRLNTIDRLRERRQSRELLEQQQQQQQQSDEKQQQQQIQNDYTLKSEEIQDPIIRRALERFDEKNRTLAQTKSMNYDDIQDPITRRALMRLESNLKRTLPSTTPTTNPIDSQSNNNWYTENYTLGSLQPSSSSTLPNSKTKYISIHQHYCTPSSNDFIETTNGNTEQDLSVHHPSAQPIYLTSTNQPLSFRQRSRSEDMLSSKDLTIGQTTNLDDVQTSSSSSSTATTTTTTNQLQRNRSSNEIASNNSGYLVPNTIIKSLEPNFIRTTESTVSYVTPTQTYSAYSCEYIRPRRNPIITSTETLATNSKESTAFPSSIYSQPQNDIQRPTPYRSTQTPPSVFSPVQTSTNTTTTTSNYYGQQPIPTSSYASNYTSNNSYQTPSSEDPIVRRALDRFNSQLQSSYLSTSQYPSANNYLSRQTNPSDSYFNSNRSNLMTTSTSSGGYQSIIGRRRQTRYEDSTNYFNDNPTVGDAYSSSIFANSQNIYPLGNRYMDIPDQPPVIPPRMRRMEDSYDHYRRHSTDEYLTDNFNHNNNNNNNNNNNINSQTLPREAFIHHAYPATITNSTGFRPINTHYNQYSSEHEEYLDRAHSTSSTNSSEGFQRSRQLQQQKQSPDNSTLEGTSSGDSGFHRLAYTGTKTALSKSSSNLLNKNSSQTSSNQLQTCQINFDETLSPSTTTIIDHTNDQISTSNKYQRSKSVDPRGRLKLTQTRTNNDEDEIDEQQKPVPSSRFTPVHTRPPLTPTATPRTMQSKRPSNGNHFSYSKNSNGNIYDHENQQQDIENEENIQYQDENRGRISIPVHRYTNNIQSSPSISSMNSNQSRTKPPVSAPMNFERKDSNGSIIDSNRTSRRSDDHRLISPGGQRRNIPVSVFAPAKIENKRPAPAPPTITNSESQSSCSSSTENEFNRKASPSSGQKTPTSSILLNEFSVPTEKTDNPKKMNVFERLFRGNKKKT